MNIQRPNYNFGRDRLNVSDWKVVVDAVMGGKSQAIIVHTDSSIILEGTVSLENNGGFASMRTKEFNFDISKYSNVTITYRSTGQSFSFYINRYRKHYEPKFRTDIPITHGEWSTIKVDLSAFKIIQLGKEIDGEITKQDLSKIIKLGFISNTKAATHFMLEVDTIIFE